VARFARGQTAQVTLKLHHFLSAVSNGHMKFVVPWAKKVEADSGGRIRIEVFPSMQLGGAPAQLYDQARSGIADIVWARPADSPGRFLRIETFELPFVASPHAVPNSKALQEFARSELMDEFGEVHPICFWTHDQGVVHASRPIRAIEDLKGLKLRAATRLAGEALALCGANTVAMPVPLLRQALAQKVVDGCALPWEAVPGLRILDLVKFHCEIAGPPTFTTTTFVLAMNPMAYDSLPAELKTVIDDNSGESAAALAGKMWDDQAIVVEESARKQGHAVVAMAADEVARWRKAVEPVIANWRKQIKERGGDGDKLIDAAKSLIAKYEKT
jgi:TRAP-type transport system periplasmic protein